MRGEVEVMRPRMGYRVPTALGLFEEAGRWAGCGVSLQKGKDKGSGQAEVKGQAYSNPLRWVCNGANRNWRVSGCLWVLQPKVHSTWGPKD